MLWKNSICLFIINVKARITIIILQLNLSSILESAKLPRYPNTKWAVLGKECIKHTHKHTCSLLSKANSYHQASRWRAKTNHCNRGSCLTAPEPVNGNLSTYVPVAGLNRYVYSRLSSDSIVFGKKILVWRKDIIPFS